MESHVLLPFKSNLNVLSMSEAGIKNQILATAPARKVFYASSLFITVGDKLTRATCDVDNVLLGQKDLLNFFHPVLGTLKRRSSGTTTKRSMRYSVQFFSPGKGIKLVNKDRHMENYPIVVVTASPGNAEKEIGLNAIRILGMQNFPVARCRPLCAFKSNYIDPPGPHAHKIYTLFYGGTDSQWFKDLSKTVDAVARDEIIRSENIFIELCLIKKGTIWDRLLELIKTQNKNTENQKFLNDFKKNCKWAVLMKRDTTISEDGSKILNVLKDFEKWKENVPENGFETCFKNYHDRLPSR